MKHVKNVTNNTTNQEVKNMENNTQAQVNAAEAAATQVAPEQIQVPTPPAQGEAQQAQPAKKEKKPGLVKKILLIIGAILALVTGGFIAGRVSGKKADRDDDDLEYVDINNDQNG